MLFGDCMENWEKSEIECFEFLKNNYSKIGFEFERKGSANSTESDIILKKNGILCFYIESKMKTAQSGQFVLIFGNDNIFVYSDRNPHPKSNQATIIIDKMNENPLYYSNPGTKGVDLNMDKNYFYDWVIDYYKTIKKVKYVIVEKELGKTNSDNFLIFPIEHFHNYFDISAKFRVKKSGSTSPSQNNFAEIESLLKKANISFSNMNFSGKKLFISLVNKDKKFKLLGSEYDYQFNPISNNNFEIRRLSNTKNSNVIFSISLKNSQNELDLQRFQNEFN